MVDQMGSVEEAMELGKDPRARSVVVLLVPDTIRSIAPVLEKSGHTKATMGEWAAKLDDYYDGDDDERSKGNWKLIAVEENFIECLNLGKGAVGLPLKGWHWQQVMQVYDQDAITSHGLDATINGGSTVMKSYGLGTMIKEIGEWGIAIKGDEVLAKAFDWGTTINPNKVGMRYFDCSSIINSDQVGFGAITDGGLIFLKAYGSDATINITVTKTYDLGATIIKEAEDWGIAINGDAVLTKAFDWETTIDQIKVFSNIIKFGQVPAKAYDTGFAIIGTQVLVPAYDFGAVINDGQVLMGAYGSVMARDWTGYYHSEFLMEVGLGDTASHLMNGMLDLGAVAEPCD